MRTITVPKILSRIHNQRPTFVFTEHSKLESLVFKCPVQLSTLMHLFIYSFYNISKIKFPFPICLSQADLPYSPKIIPTQGCSGVGACCITVHERHVCDTKPSRFCHWCSWHAMASPQLCCSLTLLPTHWSRHQEIPRETACLWN